MTEQPEEELKFDMESPTAGLPARRGGASYAFAGLLVGFLLLLIWGGFLGFVKHDQDSAVNMFKSRQRAFLYVGYDIFRVLTERTGDLGLGFIENFITHKDINFFVKGNDLSRFYEEQTDLLAYGNMLVYYDGKPAKISGEFSKYYNMSPDGPTPLNPPLHERILRYCSALKAGNPKYFIASDMAEVNGEQYQLTAGKFHFPAGDAVAVLYAKRDDILKETGYYFRREIAAAASGFFSLVVILFGLVLVRNTRRERKSFESIERTASALQNEIMERAKAEAERESLREQLFQSQKLEAIGTLAGGVAHDFNNILAVIMGTADNALVRMPADDPTREKFDRILKASRSARNITMKLLTFSRKEKLAIRSLPVNAVIGEITEILSRSALKKVKIESETGKCLPEVTVDENQMQQALLNICLNAIDAMPQGGTLRIITGKVELDENFCASRPEVPPGEYVQISIVDTGHGIPEEIIGRIFDPFFTTKEKGKGTGLGLSIAMGIIKSHDGFINVKSGPGSGAAFDVFLPVGKAASPAEPRITYGGRPSKGETILIVDDDEDMLEMLTETLSAENYNPIAVNSGDKALEIFKERSGRIDLVLLDMIMPDMDGEKVFEAIKAIAPETKIVLCSGYSLDGQAKKLLQHGAISFVQKPFVISLLCGKIREALDA